MKSKGLILAFLATVFLSVNVPALDFTVKNITIEQAIMQINMKFGYSIVVNASDVRERAWEFAAEGLSFWDYKRWNRLERLAGPMKSVIGKTMYTRNVTGRDYLWPIPQNERDRNPNIGKQNPGW